MSVRGRQLVLNVCHGEGWVGNVYHGGGCG